MKVLEGIRVVDFGRYIAGPYCAALLADYGAEVIRVDRVGGSEDRFIVPVTERGEGALFLQVNRNKRSLTLDLEAPEGREVVRRLVERADVIVANMPPRTLQALGLDYASLCRIRPDIILTASTAFGTGEDVRDRVGFDGVGQAYTGLVHLGGLPDHPMKAMVPVLDFGTAMACAMGTVLALYERQRSGQGQEVAASLLATGLNYSSGALIEESLLGLDRGATLNRSPSYGPSDIFHCADGWIITQVIGQPMFKRWCRLVGRPEFFDDPLYANDQLRGENGQSLSDCMSRWCAEQPREEALRRLESARIPAGPVNSPRQVLDSATVRASGLVDWVDYPGAAGPVPMFSNPVALSRTPPRNPGRPPLAGEHSDEILAELGYDGPAIADLRARGVV